MTPAPCTHPTFMPDEWLEWTSCYWNIKSFEIGYRNERPCIIDDIDYDTYRYNYEDYPT